eukprot:CAMPEP_0170489506 /NCGR_PEP_ID=MMETSP0208-20121228/7862_1 /TAXON_ID=197538 /ORGANISM="Strombidium inclinatum, Strain S3" /LENGTH=149 /DNA_ID=CAMNT_0010764467 /DNA_START=437 /DNA_END=887 /DNA_ORIENTATION=+
MFSGWRRLPAEESSERDPLAAEPEAEANPRIEISSPERNRLPELGRAQVGVSKGQDAREGSPPPNADVQDQVSGLDTPLQAPPQEELQKRREGADARVNAERVAREAREAKERQLREQSLNKEESLKKAWAFEKDKRFIEEVRATKERQ